MTTPTPISSPHDGATLERTGKDEVIDCTACGFAHVLPLPSVEDLKRLYSEKFYGEDKTSYLAEMEEDRAWWDMVYSERLETVEALLNRSGECRILDVGCSFGFFLTAARSRGWDTVGIELGRQAAEIASRRGLEVINEDIQNVDWASLGTFDAIYSSFVLEHLPNPFEVLLRLRSALKPGGVICIEVPNDFNPLQAAVVQALGTKRYWVAPDHHLNYFNPRSLHGLVERAGFEVSALEGTFPMELFLMMGDNYIGDGSTGRRLHGKRKRLELLMSSSGLKEFKRGLYKHLVEKGVGREIVLYARKPVGNAS